MGDSYKNTKSYYRRMPNPTTHLLVPLILADIYRDYIAKKKFKLFFILAAGIAGLLPDIDIAIGAVMKYIFNLPGSVAHRQFTHTIFIPLIFLAVALLWRKNRQALLLFSMIAFGSFTHIILDMLLQGQIMPFYPLSGISIGISFAALSAKETIVFFTLIDGILLGAWLIHEYAKHRIRDFI